MRSSASASNPNLLAAQTQLVPEYVAVKLKLILLLPQPVQSKNKLSLAISVTKRRLVCSLYPTPHPCIIFVNCLFSPKTVKYASDKRLPSSKYKYSENIDLCIEIFKIHAFLTFLKRILASLRVSYCLLSMGYEASKAVTCWKTAFSKNITVQKLRF